MSCSDVKTDGVRSCHLLQLATGVALLALLSACSNRSSPPAVPPIPRVEPAQEPGRSAPAPTAPLIKPEPLLTLGPPKPVRTHDELRKQAALRLVAANPDHTYISDSPPVLLAIPVLEVELHHDGNIKRINVIRRPGQASETVQMAIDALRRAAPFGNVSRMPEPWKFTETFLFNDERRFKPRTLD